MQWKRLYDDDPREFWLILILITASTFIGSGFVLGIGGLIDPKPLGQTIPVMMICWLVGVVNTMIIMELRWWYMVRK